MPVIKRNPILQYQPDSIYSASKVLSTRALQNMTSNPNIATNTTGPQSVKANLNEFLGMLDDINSNFSLLNSYEKKTLHGLGLAGGAGGAKKAAQGKTAPDTPPEPKPLTKSALKKMEAEAKRLFKAEHPSNAYLKRIAAAERKASKAPVRRMHLDIGSLSSGKTSDLNEKIVLPSGKSYPVWKVLGKTEPAAATLADTLSSNQMENEEPDFESEEPEPRYSKHFASEPFTSHMSSSAAAFNPHAVFKPGEPVKSGNYSDDESSVKAPSVLSFGVGPVAPFTNSDSSLRSPAASVASMQHSVRSGKHYGAPLSIGSTVSNPDWGSVGSFRDSVSWSKSYPLVRPKSRMNPPPSVASMPHSVISGVHPLGGPGDSDPDGSGDSGSDSDASDLTDIEYDGRRVGDPAGENVMFKILVSLSSMVSKANIFFNGKVKPYINYLPQIDVVSLQHALDDTAYLFRRVRMEIYDTVLEDGVELYDILSVRINKLWVDVTNAIKSYAPKGPGGLGGAGRGDYSNSFNQPLTTYKPDVQRCPTKYMM